MLCERCFHIQLLYRKPKYSVYIHLALSVYTYFFKSSRSVFDGFFPSAFLLLLFFSFFFFRLLFRFLVFFFPFQLLLFIVKCSSRQQFSLGHPTVYTEFRKQIPVAASESYRQCQRESLRQHTSHFGFQPSFR